MSERFVSNSEEADPIDDTSEGMGCGGLYPHLWWDLVYDEWSGAYYERCIVCGAIRAN